MEKLERDELEEALIVARLMWLRRNSFVFNKEFTPPQQVPTMAADSLAQFKIANARPDPVERISVYQQWVKLTDGWVKVNYDAAIELPTNRMGIGVVIRDASGEVQAAMTQVIPYINDSVMAKSLATWKAVSFYHDSGFTQVIVEGDSQSVVSTLCQDMPCTSSNGGIIEATRAHLVCFSNYEVQHVCRSTNTVAHPLVKVVVKQSLANVWMGVCPSILDNVLFEKL